MPIRLNIVQCASPGCDNTFATRSKDFELYCPECRLASIRRSGWRLEEAELPEDYDCVHDPDFVLKRKLESAAFSILHAFLAWDTSLPPSEVWPWEGEVPLSGRHFYAKAAGTGLTILISKYWATA